jgi:hypothetical protein
MPRRLDFQQELLCPQLTSTTGEPVMLELLASALIASSQQSEEINRFCAYVVGIPYASDNFTDEEWGRFVFCREHLRLP